MNTEKMDHQKILKSLEASHFTKIINSGNWFENHAVIYAKEIKDTAFLLFVVSESGEKTEDIRALIAQFDDVDNIGKREPERILFYLSIRRKNDLHYFEKFMKVHD
ncbi:hypothetical protein [Chryseobacterium limigenitum]|uniref:Uncharacterized protein n=1 Tax=Chryseobacterium limigenitum TaxID=1612149 RepID=A0A1K2ID03_9FLAO|nr:hypothetical protein [Chryseobacterium limigenitum]SFZ90168.1 hypothetical protein SAMN05216324_101240 [Chryseobacterium limigenitum]